jgi:hypothetical protein
MLKIQIQIVKKSGGSPVTHSYLKPMTDCSQNSQGHQAGEAQRGLGKRR